MAVRTFTRPSSLDKAVASLRKRLSQSNGAPRSHPAELNSDQSANMTPKSEAGITFAGQHRLPKLPVPELDSTCEKYLRSLHPLQTAKEHRDTKIAVKEFLHTDGLDLQERLHQYAKGRSNYIEQFWYDSYLNFDNPVVLNLNPFFLLEDDPTPARNNQVTRAASLVVSALSFVRAVRKEELPPDKLRGTPLCMYQYSRLFGTARIPTEHGCQIGQDPDAKHIVVLCHGQFYWFDVLDDNSDLIMTEKDVSVNLQVIIEDASEVPIQEAAKASLGILTTENRKIWSGLRDVLQRDPDSNNFDCLNIVDSALFILCLDYTEPQNLPHLCTNMLCGTSKIEKGVQVGTCTNRWYDKLQIIVCKNGSAGINFEHTGVDGHTVLRFASDVYTDTILRFAHSINGQAPSLWASTSPDPAKRDLASFGDVQTTPHKLEWDMVPELSTALRFAETRLADLIGQNEFATLEFAYYGKNFMTSMGFSPDAFVQMAFQAAYYGLYGRIECVYEPSMTKTFYHGRTEAIRSVSDESVDFVRTFWGDHAAHKKVEALRKACERHVAITKECAKGQGHDRHLYALYCMWQHSIEEGNNEMRLEERSPSAAHNHSHSSKGSGDHSSEPGSPILPSQIHAERHHSPHSPGRRSMLSSDDDVDDVDLSGSLTSSQAIAAGAHMHQHSMPALFADCGWDRLNTTVLSTSNCGNPSLRQFGFGPTSAEGFGLGYIIKDGSVSICASSKHRQTARFVECIESYFLEIRKLIKLTTRRGPGADKTVSRARMVEEARAAKGRGKARGRNILAETRSGGTIATPTTESTMESDEDGLGGYGFFDAGMLQAALKARKEEEDTEKTAVRRNVGRRLRIAEY